MLRSRINVAAVRRLPSPSPLVFRLSIVGTRGYASPTAPRPAPPAAVMTESTPQYDAASVMYTTSPRRDSEPHRFNPPGHYPMRVGGTAPLRLAHPLPTDITPPPRSAQGDLYRSTAAIDTLAMLSICSKKPEFVPRAFQIFNHMLAEATETGNRLPDIDAWVSVIHGIAQLAKSSTIDSQEKVALIWRRRCIEIIGRWEESQNVAPGTPALGNDGIRLYRAWFDGLVRVGAPLDDIMPYIESPQIGVASIIASVPPDEREAALAQVSEYAAINGRGELGEQVREVQGIEQGKRELSERPAVPEVNPVLEVPKAARRTVKSRGKLPEVRADDPKNARFMIQNLRENLAHINTPLTAYNRQLELEKASYTAAHAELQHAAKQLEEAGLEDVTNAQAMRRNGLQIHMHKWLGLLTERLETNLAAIRERVLNSETEDVEPPKWTATAKVKESTLLLYLSTLPPKKLALITILELMRMVGSGGIPDGMKVLRGIVTVGKAIETENRADVVRSVAGTDSRLWAKTLDPKTNQPNRMYINQMWNEIGRSVNDSEDDKTSTATSSSHADMGAVWTPPWSQMVQMAVGSYLVEALMSVAKVTRRGTDALTGEEVVEEQPAFSHTYEYVRGKKLGILRLNPGLATRLAHDSVRPVIHPKHLPMLVPPRPWSEWNNGAYLVTAVQAMRFKESLEQINYLKEASKKQHLTPVFHGLDVLSSTPWAINRQVFDVVLDAWNSGEQIGEIPATAEKCTYDWPEKPDPKDSDPAARSAYVERLKAVNLQSRKDHAERCKYNYNLEIARSYLNDVFYIPHNMDFRGRAYPIPPHLSPVGDDLSRGLLTFGVKKPLGEHGLKWLQIHLANLYGFDKASFTERAQFARDHETEIMESADNPLGGNKWWLGAEDPWQCLACCFEITNALRSGDPSTYESSLPVHQDGTCNGMQHYAALGGDVRGAKAVNLEKGDRPADIYSGVAELVNQSIEQDRKDNVPMALLINGPLGRKVVKQTVMTTVYGVTFVGARDQIAKQLIARGGIDAEDIYHVSAYVARKVLSSIGDLFYGAKSIQDWLTLSARLIARSIPPERVAELEQPKGLSKSRAAAAAKNPGTKSSRLAKELMTSVIWTTPLGLPVVQPYRKAVKKQVMTSLQTVYISDPNAPSEVSPHKQATAFPPNYIHSLDATHMLLTAVQCNQNNVTFASVHDSYWTHASTVEQMSEGIRETFIHLHSQDLVGELRAEFLERYGDHYIPINNTTRLLSAAKLGKKRTKPKTSATAGDDAVADTGAEGAVDPESLADEKIVPGEEGIDEAELGQRSETEIYEVAGHRFVRFSDMLPEAPPRGHFDVERIRESQYFFS